MERLPDISEIRKRRRALGVTQRRLALLSRLSQSAVAKIESGKMSPSYVTVKSMFESLSGLETAGSAKASEIMRRPVASVSPRDPVSKALRIMSERGFSQMPVMDRGRPVGSVSEKAFIDRLEAGEEAASLRSMSVGEVMGEPFPITGMETTVQTLASLLSSSFAVLVSDRGRIAGIVTRADIIRKM